MLPASSKASVKAVSRNREQALQRPVIDITKMTNNGRVIFGATVTLLKSETEEEVVYRIVGDDEADIKQNMISVNSPIARALIGKEVDDVAIVKTPAGDVEYEIPEVAYL